MSTQSALSKNPAHLDSKEFSTSLNYKLHENTVYLLLCALKNTADAPQRLLNT